MGLITESNLPEQCPKCNEEQESKTLEGPFTRYKRRRTEVYFDLEEKYLTCRACGEEVTVVDFQVLVDDISATLPVDKARPFSVKMMKLYRDNRDHAIEVLSILTGDFTAEPGHADRFLEELEQLIQTPRAKK